MVVYFLVLRRLSSSYGDQNHLVNEAKIYVVTSQNQNTGQVTSKLETFYVSNNRKSLEFRYDLTSMSLGQRSAVLLTQQEST